MSAPKRTTTAQSREPGAALRSVRRAAGLGAAEVAEGLGWSSAKLSKLEQGWRGASSWDIGVLLGRCGADRATRDRLMLLAAEPHTGYFVRPHGPDLVEPAGIALHERAALTISCYEPSVVPVLLQTEAYARASPTGESAVRSRAARQAVLHGDRVPESVFYLREEALRRPIGDASTVRDQMMTLAFLSCRPNLVLRLVPAGARPAPNHPSTVLTFAGGSGRLVHTSTDMVTVFMDDERAVRSHVAEHAVVARLAWDVDRSREFFAHLADAHDR